MRYAPSVVEELRVSVVIEWENVQLAEARRSHEMLRRLAGQAHELVDATAANGSGDVRVLGPVELILLYDDREIDSTSIASLIDECVGPDSPDLQLRLVPSPGGTYYELKNEGSQMAGGDVVVFVDSDVIPEQGWLASLLRPFADPAVQIVGGNSYIEPAGIYSKAFALFWFFPLRAADGDIYEHRGFMANNVAFRRATLERFPFPALEGTSRGACDLLADTLRGEGIPIYRNPSARVSHPPPNGLHHFVRRAVAEGRDDLVRARELEEPKAATLRGSLTRYRSHVRRARYRLKTQRGHVGLSPLGLVPAATIAAAYYTLSLAGELLTHASPEAMEKRFHV